MALFNGAAMNRRLPAPPVPGSTIKTTCAKPLTFYEILGKKTPSGKRVISPKEPPKRTASKIIHIDCGQCTGCRIQRRMDLALRLEHESQFHKNAWFVTLTYAPESEPQYLSLVADHTSKFIRALRQKTKQKISYFAIGEYGSTCVKHEIEKCPACGPIQRPHYHLIIFGLEIADKQVAYTRPNKNHYSSSLAQLLECSDGVRYWRSPLLDSVWKKGIVNITSVSEATMQYVAKYHVEKITGDLAETHYTRILDDGSIVELEHPQARMSSNPALGRKWIEKNWTNIYLRDGTMTAKGGAKFAPPRYYDKWLEKNHPDVYLTIKEKREQHVLDDLLGQHGQEFLIDAQYREALTGIAEVQRENKRL